MTYQSKIFWRLLSDGSVCPIIRDEKDEFGDRLVLHLATGMVLRYVDPKMRCGDFPIRVHSDGSVWAHQRFYTKARLHAPSRLSKTRKWVELVPAIRPRGYSYVASTKDVFCAVKYL